MRSIYWLTGTVVDAIHMNQIREHGGRHGLREENLLESTLARPKNKFCYTKEKDIASLAAAYGYGLARNHPFVDDNKSVAFMAMYVFLGLNGFEIAAEEQEVVLLMTGLADGSISEEMLTKWLKNHIASSNNRDEEK